MDYLAWTILIVLYFAFVIPFVGSIFSSCKFDGYPEFWAIGAAVHVDLGLVGGIICAAFWALSHLLG